MKDLEEGVYFPIPGETEFKAGDQIIVTDPAVFLAPVRAEVLDAARYETGTGYYLLLLETPQVVPGSERFISGNTPPLTSVRPHVARVYYVTGKDHKAPWFTKVGTE